MKLRKLFGPLLCAALFSPVLLAQHTPESVLYRRTDNAGPDFNGTIPSNIDLESPFGELDDGSLLSPHIDADREPGTSPITLGGDNYDLAFVFQFYDADGVFSFTENFDDKVRVVATPIAGSTDLTATGVSQEHSNLSWNTRTFANYDFGSGGWFNAEIVMVEDGGGAQSAADIGFGYYNDFSTNTADFGGIGYTGTFGVSSGAPAAFDTDANGESWGAYVLSFDPDVDTDGDSIPDGYEEIYFPGDLTQLGLGDLDGDGLNDPDEYAGGTDPTDTDSDDDGAADGEEVANGTDPLNQDTDGDSLLDGVETNTGIFVDADDTGTDPLAVDTDEDGFEDSVEVANQSDPNDADNVPDLDPNLLIGVDATGLGLGDGVVVDTVANPGFAGNFTTLIGQVETVSHPANDNPGVSVQGLAFNGDKMVSANSLASTSLTGNQSYTVMAWVFNPGFGNEEAIVSWGHRGGPNGSNSGMHQGNHPTFGAIGHWGGGAVGDPNQPDVGWGPDGVGTDINVTQGRWAHLAYVWDGAVDRVYIDGEFNNSEAHIPLNPHLSFNDGSPTPFALGSESDAGNVNSTPIPFSGTIARVRVEDLARTDAQILAAFNSERPLFFDGILNVTDSDGDGIADELEDQHACLDRNVPDADEDPDDDGLSNADELLSGTDPCEADSDGDGVSDGDELGRLVNGVAAPTNPLNEDSDGDGLLDGVETGTGVNLGETDRGTDPLLADSDGDRLSDAEEITAGTDPSNPDTDGDGDSDGSEISLGTDPLDPTSVPDFPASQIVKVDMTSLDQPDGTIVEVLANQGQAGEFSTLIGQVEVVSHPANDNPDVQVQGLAFEGDKMTAAVAASTVGLEGNQSYTVRAWVYNTDFGNEETIVSWGRRGGPLGSNAQFNQGAHPTFGAIGHWGGGPVTNPAEPDVGWGPNGTGTDILETRGRWAQLAYVYDGLVDRVYIDGEFNNEEEHPNLLDVHGVYQDGSPTLLCLGAGSDAGGANNTPQAFSGTIALVEVHDEPWTDEEIQAAFERERPLFFDGVSISEGDIYGFTVSSADGGGTIDFQWNSSGAEVYTIVTTEDPAGSPDPNLWAPVAGLENLAATPPLNSHSIARPAGDLRFFKLVAGPVPALFSDDLEGGNNGWTTLVNDEASNTVWELGTPGGTTGPLSGSGDSGTAWSTNLGDYGPDSDVALRTPAIDLSGLGGAVLKFDQYRDADGFADAAFVRFLRASDEVQLGAEIPIEMGTLDTDWNPSSVTVPAEALGETILVEFRFVSDGSVDAFSGLSLDNFELSAE